MPMDREGDGQNLKVNKGKCAGKMIENEICRQENSTYGLETKAGENTTESKWE